MCVFLVFYATLMDGLGSMAIGIIGTPDCIHAKKSYAEGKKKTLYLYLYSFVCWFVHF